MINEKKKSHIEIAYQPGGKGENFLKVDGFDIAGMTRGFSVYGDVSQYPEVGLTLSIHKVDVETDGYIKFNGIEVPEILARGIYEQLHARFGTANNAMNSDQKNAG